jgi:two-component sensor histidine kinase
MLIREMDHRVKNLFAVSSSVVTLSARSARTPEELASVVRDRLAALARAHSLTLPTGCDAAARTGQPAALFALIHTIAAPYNGQLNDGRPRIRSAGPTFWRRGGDKLCAPSA